MSINIKLVSAFLAASCTCASLLMVADAKVGKAPKTAPVPAPTPTPTAGVLTAIPGTPPLQNQVTAQFQFIVCGDSRPNASSAPLPQSLGQILTAAQTLKPAFMLFVGDTIFGHNPGNQNAVNGEYLAFSKLMGQAKVPVFNCPGNHEMGDANDNPNATMAAYYTKYMGAPYGSFTYGNSTFIALNTEEIPPAGTPKAPSTPGTSAGYVSSTQMAWLKSVLDQSINQDNVFIFMHHPIYGSQNGSELRSSCAGAIVNLVKNYPNVAYIIGGHEHHYFNPQSPSNLTTPPQRNGSGGPQYIVSGGAGAPLLAGGFYHYLLFTVTGKQVSVQLVRI